MADKERVVKIEMPLARHRIISARPNPAEPTTNPRRKKKMIPSIVRMLGVKTPAKVPRVPVFATGSDFLHVSFSISLPYLKESFYVSHRGAKITEK